MTAERDYSRPLNLELVETRVPVAQLPLLYRRFAGRGYRTTADHERLEKQHDRVKYAMADGKYRTLREIADMTGDPEASISAQLRHLRKPGFGSHKVTLAERAPGLWECRVILNENDPILERYLSDRGIRKDAWGRWLRMREAKDRRAS